MFRPRSLPAPHELYTAAMDALGLTARWAAAARALETARTDRLFEDPFAAELAGDEGFRLLGELSRESTTEAYLPIRTRFFDDFLLEAARDVRQIVIVGAGMDARAFRLNWPAGVTLFEVETEAVVLAKEPILQRMGAAPRCDRRVVAADVMGDWEERLFRAGFDRGVPSAFLLEGLLFYLEEAQARALLSRISGVAPAGSKLGGDLVDRALLRSPFARDFLSGLRKAGVPWRFGTATPEELLSACGWNAIVTLPGEPAAHYGRWRYGVQSRDVPGLPRSYFVRADRLLSSAP
jgi:methyltransferase (TIGR00027 family)